MISRWCMQGCTNSPSVFWRSFWEIFGSWQTSSSKPSSCLSFNMGVPTLPVTLSTDVPQAWNEYSFVNCFFLEIGIPNFSYLSLLAWFISSSRNATLLEARLNFRLGTTWIVMWSSIYSPSKHGDAGNGDRYAITSEGDMTPQSLKISRWVCCAISTALRSPMGITLKLRIYFSFGSNPNFSKPWPLTTWPTTLRWSHSGLCSSK